jgi:hypothetical protein
MIIITGSRKKCLKNLKVTGISFTPDSGMGRNLLTDQHNLDKD